MLPKSFTRSFLILVLLAGFLSPTWGSLAADPALASGVTAFDLIIAMNTLRESYGLPALKEDPIIDAVAQSTAEIMAANQMSSHIGDVRGRIAAAGYGGGATVWATENFAVGTSFSIDQIMQIWSDAAHMIPAVNAAYCNIGAGVARSSNGRTYYILQAAYTSAKSCGDYTSPKGVTVQPGGSTGVSQVIVPVKIAAPDAEGRVFHIVEPGQSLWAIAIAYKITIRDLETWNNLASGSKLQVGQKLFIPTSNTVGYATPTPVGFIKTSKPDADGKLVHTVQAYQTLITIAQAYGVSVQTILDLNSLQVDWPLRIDQKLLISPGSVTPSPTPRPLSPIQKLTPASDGKYYHTVKSGETLSLIAQLYEIRLVDLMAWNGLDGTSVLHPEDKLLLQVTLPATVTPTLAPVTITPTLTPLPPTSTASETPIQSIASPTTTVKAPGSSKDAGILWFLIIAGSLGSVLVVAGLLKRRH